MVIMCCCLYTSDAVDEGLGLDLGGRRLIEMTMICYKLMLGVSERAR